MAAIIAMLRAVNVGGKSKLKMEALREVCISTGLRCVQTYIQSGNVVFETGEQDLARIALRLEEAIENSCGFRPAVILRTLGDMREVVAKNPFAGRPGMEPSKLLVTFLPREPRNSEREQALAITADPEEIVLSGRQLYICYPDGMGRSKLSPAPFEKALRMPGTARNWNTVTKLLEIAEKLELDGPGLDGPRAASGLVQRPPKRRTPAGR